jgi:cell division protein FtsB
MATSKRAGSLVRGGLIRGLITPHQEDLVAALKAENEYLRAENERLQKIADDFRSGRVRIPLSRVILERD